MPSASQQPSLNAYDIHEQLSNSQLVRELLSHSRRGKAVARTYAEARQRRDKKPDQESQRLLIMAECERLSVAFYEFVDLVLDCEMLAAGFHYHRGEWRKRRVPKEGREEQNDQPVAAAKQPAQPKRATEVPPPRRRAVPFRQPLNCRCPLVRGAVRRKLTIHRTRPRKRPARDWTNRRVPRRPVVARVGRPVHQWHANSDRIGMIGHSNRPRPPPMAGGAGG